ncbi:MAG TPA: hypothetical protein VEB66_05440 [Opitutaceae bacterium]|nr:hypothetical protein [Opitutaceae bacterium]
MTLTPEQKQAVSSWVAAGDNLSTVQKKLNEQFQISLTYMDVRFLVDDLGLELKNAAAKAAADANLGSAKPADGGAPRPAAPPPEKKGLMDKLKEKVGLGGDDAPEDEGLAPDEEPYPDEELPPAGAGAVKVDIDRIVRPGSVVSGTVTFSDGVSGKWALDQYGRLMLETGQKGYQPPAADVQAFQRELSMQLQRQGY